MKIAGQWEFAFREVSDSSLKFSLQGALGTTYPGILPTYVAIIMANYFKLHYVNLFLRLFCHIISSFLYFRMTSEQSLWQIHVGGARSQSGLRFVF